MFYGPFLGPKQPFGAVNSDPFDQKERSHMASSDLPLYH